MAKTFDIKIEGLKAIVVESYGYNGALAVVLNAPDVYRLKRAPKNAIITITNRKTAHKRFFRLHHEGTFYVSDINLAKEAIPRKRDHATDASHSKEFNLGS